MFGLRHLPRYTRFLSVLKQKLFDLRLVIVIHDFWARSSEILFLHNSWFTRRFQEYNPAHNWKLPVSLKVKLQNIGVTTKLAAKSILVSEKTWFRAAW